MRTLIIILGGLALLGISVVVGRQFGGAGAMVLVVQIFIPLWLVAALTNMWFGVSRAGYALAEELPVFLAIFVVPTAVAAFVWWKFP